MENNAKQGSGAAKINNHSQDGDDRRGDEENPNVAAEPERLSSARTPFSDLSQVDADLALARTLQEQERAYMMLRMSSAVEGSDYGIWEAGEYMHDEGDYDDHHDDDEEEEEDSDDDEDGDDDEDEEEGEGEEADEDDEENEYNGSDDEEDAFDVHAHEEDGGGHNPSAELEAADFSSDEAYARALQDAEEREMAARLMALAGINGHNSEVSEEEHGVNAQDAWEQIDPDELSYEELIALGEVVGTESRGLSADTISSLPSVNYKAGSNQNGSNDSCVICRLDYEDDEKLVLLSCKHSYHSECINNWLQINKVCPVCSAEVSTSGNS